MLETYVKNKKNSPLTKLTNLHEGLLREGYEFTKDGKTYHIRLKNTDIAWLESKLRIWDENSSNMVKVMTAENVGVFMTESQAFNLVKDAINYASDIFDAKWDARSIIERQLEMGAVEVNVYDIFIGEINKIIS